ncbi:DUF4863 family protein [Paraburkholderia diazotrophica]|uniref:4-hydroxylaminobenzoate lyase n=1 Tax=Paraburkholderia diazotrophica TaxID=667676 RepID=UPI003D172D98
MRAPRKSPCPISRAFGKANKLATLKKWVNARLGWRHAGWIAPAPGSHLYPDAKGGALIAFLFLPSGRISYDIQDVHCDG